MKRNIGVGFGGGIAIASGSIFSKRYRNWRLANVVALLIGHLEKKRRNVNRSESVLSHAEG
jgi:hypothetical protein